MRNTRNPFKRYKMVQIILKYYPIGGKIHCQALPLLELPLGGDLPLLLFVWGRDETSSGHTGWGQVKGGHCYPCPMQRAWLHTWWARRASMHPALPLFSPASFLWATYSVSSDRHLLPAAATMPGCLTHSALQVLGVTVVVLYMMGVCAFPFSLCPPNTHIPENPGTHTLSASSPCITTLGRKTHKDK